MGKWYPIQNVYKVVTIYNVISTVRRIEAKMFPNSEFYDYIKIIAEIGINHNGDIDIAND